MQPRAVIDAHVHFWDPAVLDYPWLEDVPALRRAFLPAEYARATAPAVIERIVFVECNCRAAQNIAEAEYVERLALHDARVAAMVAYVDLTAVAERARGLETLSAFPHVRGIRHNIQGEQPGFALQSVFVDGVHALTRAGFSFDLCVTHDQLTDVIELVAQCPDTRFVLDHCGKPAIRAGRLEPWRTQISALARFPNVWCKLSGLLTEAAPAHRTDCDLLPYANHVLDAFGTERLMYGSDWPVVTLAGEYGNWYDFTRCFTAAWGAAEQQRFYHDNATRFYGL